MSGGAIRPAVWGLVAGALTGCGVLVATAVFESPGRPAVPDAAAGHHSVAPRQAPAAPAWSARSAPSGRSDALVSVAPSPSEPPALARTVVRSAPAPAEAAIDPSVAQALWLEEIAAERTARRLGLDARAERSGEDEAGSADAVSDEARTHALADALLAEYLVQARNLADVLPDGTPGAELEPEVRAIAERSAAGASAAQKVKLLEWAQRRLEH